MAIYVVKPSMPSFDEYIEAIRPIFESCILSNMGPIHQEFQQKLMDFLHVPHLSLFVNGHLALENAIQALGLSDSLGGEVITTPFTFVSTTHAIVRNGLQPVFCDIRESDYTIDPDKIEALITEKTVAIVPVHVYGNVCDVEKIDAIGAKYGLKVIYDAAHAFGVKCNGIGVGNYGDATMFSFHATKVFNSIEGGAVSFCNSDYEEKLQALKNFGIHGIEDVTLVGGNAKMDEFRAAMGLCNLRRFFECIEARKRVFMRYVERLSSFDGIQISMPAPNVEPNFAYFPVCFDEKIFGKNRDQVADQLAEQDIFARKYFYPAINNMSCYKKMPNTQPTPIAERISHQILTLPIYETLALEDVDRICDIILT